MKNRKWDSETKAMIVLEGFKGKPVNKICAEYEIGQTQYYRWREQFLMNMHQVFESKQSREALLARENVNLKKIIGDLTLEIKRGEVEWTR